MERIEKLEKEIRRLGSGDHIACIYRNRTEQLAITVPFMLAGLKNDEKCVYIVDENTKKEIIQAFKTIFNVEEYLDSNQLELLTREDAYLKDGFFDPDKMIELLKQTERRALKEGYKRLRVTGEMTWILTKLPGVERLIEYEAKSNYFFPGSKSLAICQYNEGKFRPEILLDVIHTHPKIIIYNSLCDNPHYLPPDEFFAQLKGEVQWSTYEKTRNNIITEKKIEEKAQQDERERDLILGSMSEPVIYYDREGRTKWVNEAASKFFGELNAVGKTCREVLHDAGNLSENCPVCTAWESGMYEEGEITLPGGRAVYVRANPVYEDSEIMGVVEVIEDITEHKQAEKQLKNLFDASRKINSSMDLQEIFKTVSDFVRELVGFDKFIIFLVSDDRKSVYPAYTSEGIKDLIKSLILRYGEGLIGLCTQTRETLLLEDAGGDRKTEATEMKSQIVVPLIIEGTCAGVLYISKYEANSYDQTDVAVLKPLSEVISSAIRNARLHTEIREFSRELEKRVEEKTRRTEILLAAKQALQSEKSWEKGLITIVEIMSKLGFERCGVFLVNPTRKTLEFHFAKGVEFPQAGTSISLKDTEYFGVRCVKEKKTILVRDSSSVEGKQIVPAESFVWVPIVVQDEAFAAIAADRALHGKAITDENVESLEILAGMCAAFIDRTRTLIEPVAEKTLETEIKHWLSPSSCYIVTEKKPVESFEIFVDLVTHGIPGFVISREYPEKLKRKYKLQKTPLLWLSRTEIENTLNPDDLSKLIYVIGNFARKSEESVILLDGLEYLITEASFGAVLKHLQEIRDIIAVNNSRLIIPLHKETLSSEDYSFLEREFTILEPGVVS